MSSIVRLFLKHVKFASLVKFLLSQSLGQTKSFACQDSTTYYHCTGAARVVKSCRQTWEIFREGKKFGLRTRDASSGSLTCQGSSANLALCPPMIRLANWRCFVMPHSGSLCKISFATRFWARPVPTKVSCKSNNHNNKPWKKRTVVVISLTFLSRLCLCTRSSETSHALILLRFFPTNKARRKKGNM